MACGPRRISNEEEDSEEIDYECFLKIKEVLYCPICFEMMKDPLNVKMCLHKFCGKCIEDYNRIV
jgi:hypothetical protein